nr:MAG TPA: hypothetical protein [Caudoviricetes sp.]
MIILSHTNLSGINLGGINLSEIKLGMPSGKGSGGEETFDPASFNEAWTVTGKTNNDEDRAAIKNITGNGNDLVLSNFTFDEDSGYNSGGYLVTDGVDDKIQSNSFELGKDWTMVGDWVLLQDSYKSAGVIKSPAFYAYNNVNGMVVYLKSGNIQNGLSEIKSLYAVCSDGRVYDSNWNEHQLVIGEESKSVSSLKVGVSSNEASFTKIAFKNLAIYNDKVLTKDQCIKAYDYLQTLKEK